MITFGNFQLSADKFRQEIDKIRGDKHVTVGIHEDAGLHPDSGMTNASLGATLHFGAEIIHPGGTSYGYKKKSDINDNKISFLKKGQGYAEIGVTPPHTITIPPRPWLDVGVESGTQEYLREISDLF